MCFNAAGVIGCNNNLSDYDCNHGCCVVWPHYEDVMQQFLMFESGSWQVQSGKQQTIALTSLKLKQRKSENGTLSLGSLLDQKNQSERKNSGKTLATPVPSPYGARCVTEKENGQWLISREICIGFSVMATKCLSALTLSALVIVLVKKKKNIQIRRTHTTCILHWLNLFLT